ncbi:MAG: metalloprotease [Flavobacteriaceae bacterium]|nr:metalloprotease [Flavobacteriaceae bacterium]
MKTRHLYIALLLLSIGLQAQHQLSVEVEVLEADKRLYVEQEILFKNATEDTLTKIWLYDWINAYSEKRSDLGKRYAQEYQRRFHFASDEERGGTNLKSLEAKDEVIHWYRPQKQPDLIAVELAKSLPPGEEIRLHLNYILNIPTTKFNTYGYQEGDFLLKYWLILPAVYENDWILYSDKELFDLPKQALSVDLKIDVDASYQVTSALQKINEKEKPGLRKLLHFKSKDVAQLDLYLTNQKSFETIITDYGTLSTNISSCAKLNPTLLAIVSDRILAYLNEQLGPYPNQRILASESDYLLAPIYGLNQLPSFIRPFPDGFQSDISLFKTITANYLENTIFINNRKDQWMLDAIQIYLMMDYVDRFYPDTKLLGSLSNFPILKWSHAASLDFNGQYDFLLETMTRQNLDQTIDTPQHSLLRFNKKIGNPYKAGLSMKYLENYSSKEELQEAIKDFFTSRKQYFSEVENFRLALNKNISKDVDWYFDDYITNHSFIDYKIKKVKKEEDSLRVQLKNFHGNKIPVSLTQVIGGKPAFEDWIPPFEKDTVVVIKDRGAERMAVNFDGKLPELNKRNNFEKVRKPFSKPFQFRILEDIDDPHHEQLFIIPEFGYNLYDGFYLGPKFYNTSLLPKQFSYKIGPKYGTLSNALVGDAAIDYTNLYKNKNIFAIRYGLSGSRFSYDQDLFFNRYTFYVNFAYRPQDLRSNVRQFLSMRTLSINREGSEQSLFNEPNYDVFNLNYRYQDKNLDKFFTTEVDYQLSRSFSKVSFNTRFRKLYNNNRQINFRWFGGVFLFNENRDSDFFSFALDRPTDYMFDYNYYGRSEDSGLFSQQFVMAEGGFKSMLQPAFANQWMTTFNTSTTIWNWVFAYGDVGLVKNRGEQIEFLYDSGIRLNLVEDYFELFFPVYSSNGWEAGQDDYGERIRFIVTLDIPTLWRLFTRRWY